MHDKGRKLIKNVLKEKIIKGPDKQCEYFPCHEDLEDCTFCFCPFYPCYRHNIGGREIVNSRTGKPIWACSNCIINHQSQNIEQIIEGLLEFDENFDMITRNQLQILLDKIINLNSGEE